MPSTSSSSRDRSRSDLLYTIGGISVLAALVVGLVASQLDRPDEPATVVAEVERADTRDGYLEVAVTISNTGGSTAEAARVEVTATLPDGTEQASDFEVGFLAPGQETQVRAFFPEDVAEGDVSIDVLGYVEP